MDEGVLRVVQTFGFKIGSGRIADVAWQQAAGVAAAGVEITVFPGAVSRPLPHGIRVQPTLARGPLRLPYHVLGIHRTLALHDRIVARRLDRLAGEVDVVHAWPMAALETLRAARRLGIATVLERPNAHTRFAYDVVAKESARLGVELPAHDEHAWNDAVLRREEEEYRLADYLLCPSDFVVRTFLDAGFPREKLLRHTYGFDERACRPGSRPRDASGGLTMLFAGVAAVRKGLHFALEAWVRSPASRSGTFLVVGDILPAYAAKLAPLLAHPSVRVLGWRADLPDLMRSSDAFVLPSLEEGFGLVCVDALASGCVPLVSDACTELCVHDENALVHRAGDVERLTSHITAIDADRRLLARLRAAGLKSAPEHTWARAGARLADVYAHVAAAAELAPGRVPHRGRPLHTRLQSHSGRA